MRDLFIRVDIDSHLGLTKGVPALLDLFDREETKATFFLTVGREGNLYEYLKYRYSRRDQKQSHDSYPLSRLKKFSQRKVEIARMFLAPRSLHKEESILQDIIDRGHDLEIHCYNHIVWFAPKYEEAKRDLQLAQRKHRSITGRAASGFASPYCSWNEGIAQALKESDFDYIAVHNDQDRPHRCLKTGKLNIPITLSYTDRPIPICEYWARRGLQGDELVAESAAFVEKEAPNKEFLCTYIHPRIEGIELLDEFSRFLAILNKKYNLSRTFSSIAKPRT